MKGSQILMKSLKNQGVKYIFGIVGREGESILFNEDDIKFILFRDERCAALAADAYSRITGKPCVCYSTFGPGATNLATGIYSAYMDRSQVVAISAQVESNNIHPSTHQYVNQIEMTMPFIKFGREINEASEIPGIVKEAFSIAKDERQGPVYISIPTDFFDINTDYIENENYIKKQDISNKEEISIISDALKKARFPVAIIGNCVIRNNAVNSLKRFLEKYQIAAVTTYSGKGCIREDNSLYLGTVSKYLNSFFETNALENIFSESDLIITIGYDYAEGTKPELWNFGKNKKVIRIDSIENDVSSYFNPYIDIYGDINQILDNLSEGNHKSKPREKINQIRKFILNKKLRLERNFNGLTPYRIIKIIREVLRDKDIFISDTGIHKHYACLFYETYQPRTFLCSNGAGVMGFGLPAAIGAKLAKPSCNVIALCGDGGFHSNSQDLETAARYNLPIVCIVLKDNSYGLIKYYQLKGHKKTNLDSVDFGNVDFVKLAEANGCNGYSVNTLGEFKKTLQIALKSKKPSVIEVPIKYNYSFGVEND